MALDLSKPAIAAAAYLLKWVSGPLIERIPAVRLKA